MALMPRLETVLAAMDYGCRLESLTVNFDFNYDWEQDVARAVCGALESITCSGDVVLMYKEDPDPGVTPPSKATLVALAAKIGGRVCEDEG
ncbi:hypothetical protein LTR85_009334 [Meristemomyces frigidus]|nr:hypothetical protein LTR85_009334 [Meristemomyces frigidus]